jgi:2-hydroxy-3-oxopropionate reductase
VFDRNTKITNEVVEAEAEAERGISARDVTSRSDIVITILPNSPRVKDVFLL